MSMLMANQALGAIKILGRQAASGARKVYNDAKTIDMLATSKAVRALSWSALRGGRGYLPYAGMAAGAGAGYLSAPRDSSGLNRGVRSAIGGVAGFGLGMGGTGFYKGLGRRAMGAADSLRYNARRAWGEAGVAARDAAKPKVAGLLGPGLSGSYSERAAGYAAMHPEQFAQDELGRVRGNGFVMGAA